LTADGRGGCDCLYVPFKPPPRPTDGPARRSALSNAELRFFGPATEKTRRRRNCHRLRSYRYADESLTTIWSGISSTGKLRPDPSLGSPLDGQLSVSPEIQRPCQRSACHGSFRVVDCKWARKSSAVLRRSPIRWKTGATETQLCMSEGGHHRRNHAGPCRPEAADGKYPFAYQSRSVLLSACTWENSAVTALPMETSPSRVSCQRPEDSDARRNFCPVVFNYATCSLKTMGRFTSHPQKTA